MESIYIFYNQFTTDVIIVVLLSSSLPHIDDASDRLSNENNLSRRLGRGIIKNVEVLIQIFPWISSTFIKFTYFHY